jgi:hypothetical protein
MDPTTSLIVTAAVGGAAGRFIEQITSNGVQWLTALITAQSPEMQAMAKKTWKILSQDWRRG